jgi:zinc protease
MSRPASSTAAIGVFALLALPVGEAAAQGHEAAPPPAPAKDFALPAEHELRLPNGMQVTLVQYGPLPLATLTLVVRTGSIDERPNEVWVSKLMADFLQQGTTTRPAAALAEAAAGMGGSLTVQAGDDASTIAGTALGDSAASFVRLMADVIQHPRFPESEFPRLRADRLRELAIAHTQPQQLAEERYAAMIYPDHPYGRLYPTEAALESYTPLMVRDFYAREVGAARAHLYVVGRFDINALEAAARQSFAGWPAGPPATINPPSAPHAERALAVIDRPNAVQSTVDLGVRVPDPSSPSWIPLDVTDALLGGSFGSRITSNIREDKGYTYSPFSFVQSHYRSAVWTETADVTTNVTGASLKEIFGEIDRLRATPPSTDEVRGIQNYLAGIFVLRSATREGLTRQFEFVDLHGLGGSYLSSYVRRVYAVTPADVREIAERYLDPAKMTIVVAGDQKTIANQLAPYGKTVQ